MISRIASRVASRFLRISAGVPLRPNGTVQVKNLAAKYLVKTFEGSLSDCDFRIAFEIMGGVFILAGEISNGKMMLTDVQGDPAVSLETFSSVARKYFKIDPELWVKGALENALITSVGHEDVLGRVVMDGQILDESDLFPEIESFEDVPEVKAM